MTSQYLYAVKYVCRLAKLSEKDIYNKERERERERERRVVKSLFKGET